MAEKSPPKKVSDHDRLVTRPDEPLPTVQDPQAPRGEPADPKPVGKKNDKNALDYTA